MKKEYDPQTIEKKWQKYWEENKTYKTEEDYTKPKYYILDMFPYPSGAGLHVGHVVGYTGSDVIARYKRQKGFNVLHPMGWDSFGLPAEQYAIRTGTHPQIATEQNINTYRRQLKALGLSYDWEREFATSDPKYYKWTQWIFTKLYEKGLAYETEATVNFCPALGTVLSNEEVENGKSVDGGYPIERKPLRQWMLKITAYAEKLLEDLDLIDWPDHLKKLQRNWIGKSEGVNIDFSVAGMGEKITCFTTRHDTLFGVTYVVIAPEHPLVKKLTTKEQVKEVEDYCAKVAAKSDLDRTDLAKTKTGVFTGSYIINPLTDEKVPIWIADYVLMSYGTGAVMAVPYHDERDKEFSQIYQLNAKQVIDEEGRYINSANDRVDLSKDTIDQAKERVALFLEKMKIGERKVNYKLRDWLFSRQRYWGEPFPILHYEDGSKRVLDLDELPLTPPVIQDYKPSIDGQSPLAKAKNWVEVIDPKTNKRAFRETNIMPQWAGSCWYYLRFCDPHNINAAWSPEKEAYWMPVDLYIGGVEHAVLHLLYARFWHKVLYDIGCVTTKEPFMSLRNQGLVISKAYKLEGGGYVSEDDAKGKNVTELIEKMSKSKMNGVSPDEMIEEYGADALRLYELFMAPFDKEKLWQTDAVTGCKRFLNRVYDVVTSEKLSDEENKEANRLVHKLIKQVESDFAILGFNTAIAKMMEFLNGFTSLPIYPRECVKSFIKVLYPFTPHFGEECWEILGGKNTISYEPFPTYDEAYLVEDEVTIVFQVNGKLRGKGVFSKGVTKEIVLEFATNDQNVKNFLKTTIEKVIFVPDKLLNLVTQ
ncbi:MAG: leucine--tRNA ligase [Chlamydiae bacterium]|nr:leucine--tRNA ligase [Chlamydiota bacterium]